MTGVPAGGAVVRGGRLVGRTADACAASSERGSGTVLALTVLMLAGLLVVLVAALGQAVVARHRAQAAADLAALAAASSAQEIELGTPGAQGGPCALAERIARANGARLTGCVVGSQRAEAHVAGAEVAGVEVAGVDVRVSTAIEVAGVGPGGRGLARGTARAGPAG